MLPLTKFNETRSQQRAESHTHSLPHVQTLLKAPKDRPKIYGIFGTKSMTMLKYDMPPDMLAYRSKVADGVKLIVNKAKGNFEKLPFEKALCKTVSGDAQGYLFAGATPSAGCSIYRDSLK